MVSKLAKSISVYVMLFLMTFYPFAYALDLNTMYGLTNYTPPGVVKLNQGGFFVSGGGIYIRPSPNNSSARIFYATPPSINASCGALDMFLGGIGFGGFSLLVQKFQALLMALPIVAFKIALAILAPQVNSILDDVERITDALNNMQIGQCGQIQGLDVHAITSALGDMKKQVTSIMSEHAVQNAKNFYEQISDNGKWDISNVVKHWNNLVTDSWQQLGQIYDVNGYSVNFQADPSLMDNAVQILINSGVFPNYSIYSDQNVEGFVRYLIGDFDMGAAYQDSSHNTSAFIDGHPSDASMEFSNLVHCASVDIEPKISSGVATIPIQYVINGGSSSSTGTSLDAFCPSDFQDAINSIYNDVENNIALSSQDIQTEQLLASIPYIPVIGIIQWAAVISKADGGNDALQHYITNETANALAYEIIRAFFTNYINHVTAEMTDIITGILSGKIAASGPSPSNGTTKNILMWVKQNCGPKYLKMLGENANTVVHSLNRYVNRHEKNMGQQMLQLVQKNKELQTEALNIIKGLGLYGTYLKAAGGLG